MNKDEIQFTKDWWKHLLQDRPRFNRWLQKLQVTEYEGHVDWINFIGLWRDQIDTRTRSILFNISADEANHSDLLIELMKDRGLEPVPKNEQTTSSYWLDMYKGIRDLSTCCAVNYYGEYLAAFRFEIMQEHKDTPSDIKGFLDTALPDEQFHRETLKRLAGEQALLEILPVHIQAQAKLKRQ